MPLAAVVALLRTELAEFAQFKPLLLLPKQTLLQLTVAGAEEIHCRWRRHWIELRRLRKYLEYINKSGGNDA